MLSILFHAKFRGEHDLNVIHTMHVDQTTPLPIFITVREYN